jgi:phosphoenolpyruvate carboxylase
MTGYGLQDVELVFFDTHGESPGRGAHPASLADRLLYLAPPHSEQVFAKAGIRVARETSFQGTDGYLLFGTPDLSASRRRIPTRSTTSRISRPSSSRRCARR